MKKWYDLRGIRLVAGAAILTGLLAACGSQAFAGTLEIVISDGTTSYDILDGSPLDSNPNPNQITTLASALVFPDFTVVGLNASTNNPGAPNPSGAVLTVGGEIQRITGGGPLSLTITATDEDYTVPIGSGMSLHSSTSATFTNVATSDTSSFTSWFNPSNTPLAKDIPSPTQTLISSTSLLNSSHGTPPTTTVSSGSPYGLTNETVVTLTGSTSSTPDVVFGGSTQILGAVPEPASLSLLAAGLPLAIWGWLKRRRLSRG